MTNLTVHNVSDIRVSDLVVVGPTKSTKYRTIYVTGKEKKEEVEITLFAPDDKETIDVIFGSD